MKTAPTSPDHINPTLDRVRALIALMLQFLEDPTRHLDLERLFAEAEQLLARLTFEAAARIAGRLDLLETHEAYVVSNGRRFDIRVRLKPSALHPHHRIILGRRRTARIARYLRAIGPPQPLLAASSPTSTSATNAAATPCASHAHQPAPPQHPTPPHASRRRPRHPVIPGGPRT